MNADRVISKINIEMNAFNESGSREDKACAEGLRMARTYVQQEVLKRKILTHDQQVVLDWLKATQRKENYPMGAITYIQPLFICYQSNRNSKSYQLSRNGGCPMLKSDAETLEDIRIVIMLLERVYYRELAVVGGESFITKQVDELLDAMNDIVEILE